MHPCLARPLLSLIRAVVHRRKPSCVHAMWSSLLCARAAWLWPDARGMVQECSAQFAPSAPFVALRNLWNEHLHERYMASSRYQPGQMYE
jgi:hypothetical protein